MSTKGTLQIGIVTIGTSTTHSLAATSDGTVWAWGNNWFGQIGDGTLTERHTPVQVSGLSGVIAIAGGGWHSPSPGWAGKHSSIDGRAGQG